VSIEQILVLAIVQGLTEFLPVSSSGHLILIPAFSNWDDQGIATDVMVHVGSLFAVLVYFWRDVLKLLGGCFDILRGQVTPNSRMATYIALATIPALAFGALLKYSGASTALRGIEVVAYGAIFFGILMYVADRVGLRLKRMEDMTLGPAMLIGVAQAIALILQSPLPASWGFVEARQPAFRFCWVYRRLRQRVCSPRWMRSKQIRAFHLMPCGPRSLRSLRP